MKTIGFPISHKENENRRAIIPEDIQKLDHPENVFIEDSFGKILGIDNDEFVKAGCNIVSHEEVLSQDIICDPKIGDADYLENLNKGQSIFGWIHATQNKEITDRIMLSNLTAYAWEKMYESGRHVFWFNNELAGEAAVIHAFQCYGSLPFGTEVAVLGNGNTARGAVKVLNMLGAHVIQYNRQTEKLFIDELPYYDIVVNCVLWDVNRKDHIICRSDLKRMKKGAMIIDVSCDRNGGIETSIPTTIEKPIYFVDGIMHYVVDHTPSLFFKTFSKNNSKIIVPYLNELMNENIGEVLEKCKIIEEGKILDKEIIQFQHRSV